MTREYHKLEWPLLIFHSCQFQVTVNVTVFYSSARLYCLYFPVMTDLMLAGGNKTADRCIPFVLLKNEIRTPILSPDTYRGQARWVRVCVCVCAQLCVVLIFIFIFLVEYIKCIWKVYTPLPNKKLIVLCHQFCEVIVVECSAICQSCFLQKLHNSSAWKNGRLQAGGGVGSSSGFWSLFLMYFAGLASWRWRVVARGYRVKTNNDVEVSCFCRRSCCLWSFHDREQRRGGRGKRVKRELE